ncbi:hypothetical protein JOM56_013399 [Amanita muscaria]
MGGAGEKRWLPKGGQVPSLREVQGGVDCTCARGFKVHPRVFPGNSRGGTAKLMLLMQQPCYGRPAAGNAPTGSSSSAMQARPVEGGELDIPDKDANQYLQAVIEAHYFMAVDKLVRPQGPTAYAHLIFAQENVQPGIPYRKMCNQAAKIMSPHGTPVCMNDVILAFRYMAHTTFANLRQLHHRARHAVDIGDSSRPLLKNADREQLDKLKLLLQIDLQELPSREIPPAAFGTLASMIRWLRTISKVSQLDSRSDGEA